MTTEVVGAGDDGRVGSDRWSRRPNIALFPSPGSEVTQSVEVTWNAAVESATLTPPEAAQFRVDVYAKDSFAQLASVDFCGNRTLLSSTPYPLDIDVEQAL